MAANGDGTVLYWSEGELTRQVRLLGPRTILSRMKPSTLLLSLGVLLASGQALAQAIIKHPGHHDSSVELELHGIARWEEEHYLYGHTAVGVGLRVGIPLVRNGFIPSINNQVAINFGPDLVVWPDYRGTVDLVVPVALQWSFYLASHWSVFAEAGVAVEWFPPGDPRDPGHPFGFWPGLAVGGRYHFASGAGFPSLTLRLGFPTGLNFGVSF